MKISIGCDHGGYDLKETVKKYLEEKGYEVADCGCYSKDSCDYPEYARAAAAMVAGGDAEKGIVICTTGIGVSMVANKVKGVRCALCHNEHTAAMTRLHNDANMLAMGAGELSEKEALNITEIFLTTEFSEEERHIRRVRQIEPQG